MSYSPAITPARLVDRRVLGDVMTPSVVRDVTLVVSAALLTALAARIEIAVPGSPVPISGQTAAVMLTAAALGARRGVAGQALYVGLGAIGLPFYSGGESGWDVVSGATGGYLIGFVLAAHLVGRLAERRFDRRVQFAVPAFVLGQLAIFGIGVPWLAVVADLSASEAIAQGFTPFVAGGLVKAALVGALMPAAWRAVRRADET